MKEENKEVFKDYYFYINQDLVLTKEEKNRALPRVDYNEYLKIFYKKKINSIFKNYKNKVWFKQRYCEKRNDFKERFFNFLSKKEEPFYENNILVKEINENLPDKEVKEICEKCLNFQEFNLFLSLKDKILVRNGIISVKSDLNESLNFMNSFAQQSNLKFEPIILEVNIKKSNLKTKDDLKNVKFILKIFSDFYNLTEERIEGEPFLNFLEKIAIESQNELYFYITFLRKVFLFCYYCVKQFDSFMEMNLKCGKDHIFSEEVLANTSEQDIFERSISIFYHFENFNEIANDFTSDFIENDIDKFVEKKDIEVYGCKLCSKEFSGLNFVRTHINKKHPDSMKDIKLELEFYKNLLMNLDFRLFSRVSGIDLFVLPEFIKNIMTVNRVMYSERVFSGEINVKK